VRTLKESLSQSKASLATTDPEMKKLAMASSNYDELIHTLSEIEDLRLAPDQLEARISEKRFLTAVDILQNALRRIRVPALDQIGALSELRSYLTNQESALTDILIEELHDHLYLKSPYCQERWQTIAKEQGALGGDKANKANPIIPFFQVLESMDLNGPTFVEDPTRNPESDTFYYIELLVESLNKLGRLETAVNTIKQRLPVELFGIVNETNGEVDQKHPSSLRGGLSNTHGHQAYGSRESSIRADVIYDLLWTLYAKFEAIAEGHRVFHDVVKGIVRREGARNSSMLLGGFRELWNLYQNEIRSLLHNYVTTDADVYQFSSSPKPGVSKADSKREQLFQFIDADSKSVQMTTEYHDLEGIIRAAVPGLMSGRKQAADGKKIPHRIESTIDRNSARRGLTSSIYDSKSAGIGAHKSLVEPSVFNMSLLLPPTLGFLNRLKNIVPPGSDLVQSTLTSFLDNFLVNVFLPQLEETLGKLSDAVFEESDTFQQDPQWANVARRPVFKGAAAFFALITAFCRMLDTIPHDQALSQLIITQMMNYYNRCYDWFKSLVARSREPEGFTLKLSAQLASGPGDIHDTMEKIWTSEQPDRLLLEKETGLLIVQTNDSPLRQDDIIVDRDTISSLCVLYTSMKWLSLKIGQLRHITRNDADSSRPTMQKPANKRWTLLNDPSKSQDDLLPVYLPMTHETVM
jgi:exocyst complex component 4